MSEKPFLVYAAGPEVFLPDPFAAAAMQRAACALHGAELLFPMDNHIAPGEPHLMARAIRLANEAMIARCDAVVANMRPFRGPGMDGGTAYEMGFARALGKPVIGYAADRRTYVQRVAGAMPLVRGGDGMLRDPDGLSVEDFGLVDNLMMAGGADVLCGTFAEAVAVAAALLRGGSPASACPGRPVPADA